jgi:hypothetical protein
MEWAIEATRVRDNGKVEVTLALAPNDNTRGSFTPTSACSIA